MKSGYKVFLTGVEKKDLILKLVFLPVNKKINGIPAKNYAYIEFHRVNERLRPLRFWKQKGNKKKFFQPKELINLLKNSSMIYIHQDLDFLFKEEIFSMFYDFQIDMNKIIECELCRFCLIDGLITIDADADISYFIHDKEQKICYRCAKLELLNEFYHRGAVFTNKMKKALFRTLSKVKNVDYIIKLFTDEIDPTKHPELTLFDEISCDTETAIEPPIDDLPVPNILKDAVKTTGITKLLPIQKKAVDEGLLENQDMLIVSATTTGKTLIGELAGATKSINENKKTVFLVPLVALANQKYTEFQEKYTPIGLKTAIRVGMSNIDVGDEELVIVDSNVTDADIIVGTNEAFDFLLRSGKKTELDNIGTVIIDEIQLLADPDRGAELDGLISRIRSLFQLQVICLSATVGNPQYLAEKLRVKLLTYDKRPVPLERHLILIKDNRKISVLAKLVKREYMLKSSFGYQGQTIIFTFSRRRCKELATLLQTQGINAVPYHAGLTYLQRKSVETGFLQGQYSAVITTAALATGVDFPASQVIFESLAMGKNWLTVSEFEQMSGRAGRVNYHDHGKVVLLVTPGQKYNARQQKTEDQIAIELLEGKVEDVEIETDTNTGAEQLLASISSFGVISLNELETHYNNSLGAFFEFKELLKILKDRDLISINNGYVEATPFGVAVSESFLSPEVAVLVRKQILDKEDPLNIAIQLEPFEAVYHSNKLQAELNRTYRTRFPSKFFSGAIFDLFSTDFKNIKSKRKLENWVLELFALWVLEFFDCKCEETPYCECAQIKLCQKIVKMRQEGKRLHQIAHVFSDVYELNLYPGDLFKWLDTLVHHLRAVKRISSVLDDDEMADAAQELIDSIERGTSLTAVITTDEIKHD